MFVDNNSHAFNTPPLAVGGIFPFSIQVDLFRTPDPKQHDLLLLVDLPRGWTCLGHVYDDLGVITD